MKSSYIDNDLLKRLWFTRENGISRLMQGNLSQVQFASNLETLRELTNSILSSSDHQSYLRSVEKIDELVQAGLLSFRCVALLNRVWAAAYPDVFTTTIQTDKFDYVYQRLNQRYGLDLPSSGDWFQKNTWLTEKLQFVLPSDYSILLRNMQVWYLYEEFVEQPVIADISSIESFAGSTLLTPSLNQILYGPPGTGKTFHTIEAAVKAADPKEYANIGIDPLLGANKEQRKQLTEMYKALSDVGRIRFVTFHQSYGYEEFVEGLSAKTESGQVSYNKKNGIFKDICLDAKIKPTNNLTKFERALEDLKKAVDGQFISLSV
ncbi:hypothetical protein [Vibrio scophthalmi]|uniref:Uncharacterized protein n=1 Tax=Vibrio scophthalmi TaxID=45658 RepID=A0A1E3WF37_9VIBR|nr:hypothetical protein [Vibrio scophthalmi]ODS04438.1 hypothetical protein VSF3289_03577 [Vibrio scophthalmi]